MTEQIAHARRYEDLPASEWTEAEATFHLEGTFDRCCRMWPAIMDTYVVQIAEVPAAARKELMRRALRETVAQRYADSSRKKLVYKFAPKGAA